MKALNKDFWIVVGLMSILGVAAALGAYRGTGEFLFSVLFAESVVAFVIFGLSHTRA